MENKSIQEVEILLVQCDNSIYADEVTDALFASGITSYRHDEKQYGHHGAHGPNEGIAIYVSKDNYDQATKSVVAKTLSVTLRILNTEQPYQCLFYFPCLLQAVTF